MILCELNQAAWDAWVATRPPIIQEMCAKLPPNLLYLYKSTGQRVTIESYSENGTVTVQVSGEYNLIEFERSVFGVPQDELEECDLPPADQPVGVVLSTAQAIQLINTLRAEHDLPSIKEIPQVH